MRAVRTCCSPSRGSQRRYRSRLARRLDRLVRDRAACRLRSAFAARAPRSCGNPGAPLSGARGLVRPGRTRAASAAAAPDRAAAARRSVRGREPRRLRQLFGRRSDGRDGGARLRAGDPGGQPAAPVPPVPAGAGRAFADGCGDAGQPRDPARARRRHRHTLLGAVQRTVTAAGARLLASWLAAPLTDPRQSAGGRMRGRGCSRTPDVAARLHATLRSAPDMARALGRLSVGRGGPRDLAAIRSGLTTAAEAAAALDATAPAALQAARGGLAAGPELPAALGAALAEPAPLRRKTAARSGRGSTPRSTPNGP